MLNKVSDYYTQKIKRNGASPQGVDWNSVESQYLRFEKLLSVIPKGVREFSILDYGCGYGALLDYLKSPYPDCQYTGLDISEEMIRSASLKNKHDGARWIHSLDAECSFDYAVASGTFNVKLDTNPEDWEAYVFSALDQINKVANKGFAFNLLTAYSDVPFRRERLYYASPERFFAYAKENFSRHVSLLHDYPLYEFSIVVNKTEAADGTKPIPIAI